MSSAALHPIPLNESERLAALAQFRIIGTPADPAFDEICHIVKEQLDVPIVMISLADSERHWFKACIGVPLSEVPRDTSFCRYTILSEQPLIIPDAMADARFRDNPFVVCDPMLRFYAGVPLLLRPDLALGSLCAIDIRPRTIEERQIALLRRMSHIVIEHLKHHKARLELADELAWRRRHAQRVKTQRAQLNRQRRFTERSAG